MSERVIRLGFGAAWLTLMGVLLLIIPEAVAIGEWLVLPVIIAAEIVAGIFFVTVILGAKS